MGIGSLIPFGLEAESERLVDVGNVKRGNACGCICPSCKTPLIARQGGEKEWHFAHRSQKVHDKTRKECKFSFAFSVRMMIRQLSDEGLKFKAPRLECSLSAISPDSHKSADFQYHVTDESLIVLKEVRVGEDFCGVPVDVQGLVEGVPFVIFVTYKDRVLPSEIKKPSIARCGVVELNVNDLPRLFKQEAHGQYVEALRKYIEEKTDGKTWAYHPREEGLKDSALEERRKWLLEQKTEEKSARTASNHYQNLITPRTKIIKPVKRVVGNYICTNCLTEWTGLSKICLKCNTHLFTNNRV
jgi:hypothetical protein